MIGNMITVFIIGKKPPNIENWLEQPTMTTFLLQEIISIDYLYDSGQDKDFLLVPFKDLLVFEIRPKNFQLFPKVFSFNYFLIIV